MVRLVVRVVIRIPRRHDCRLFLDCPCRAAISASRVLLTSNWAPASLDHSWCRRRLLREKYCIGILSIVISASPCCPARTGVCRYRDLHFEGAPLNFRFEPDRAPEDERRRTCRQAFFQPTVRPTPLLAPHQGTHAALA